MHLSAEDMLELKAILDALTVNTNWLKTTYMMQREGYKETEEFLQHQICIAERWISKLDRGFKDETS